MSGEAIKSRVVMVPASLLLDRRVTASAKLLWMLLDASQLHPNCSPDLMRARRALGRSTIRRGLEQLDRAGWLKDGRVGGQREAENRLAVSWDLLLDPHPGAKAKVLYGVLQQLPKDNSFTYLELGAIVGASPNTVRIALGELVTHHWLNLTRQGKHGPIHFTLRNPCAEKRETELLYARARMEECDYRGEAIMREFLSLIVDSDEYQDNARPVWLVYPLTGEPLELDRYYYVHKVAFEFQGSQHYGPTERFPDERKACEQRTRDLVKAALCNERKDEVRLITLTGADLSVDAIRRKVEGLLPLRDLTGHELLLSYLETAGRGYRRSMEKGQR